LKALADLTENTFAQQQQIQQQTDAQLAGIAGTQAQTAQQRTAMMNQQLLAEKQAKDQVSMQKELMKFQSDLNNQQNSGGTTSGNSTSS
jgi:hypothetical protein